MMYCALITTGAGDTVVLVGDAGLVVDWRVKPMAFAAQLKTRFVPDEDVVSCVDKEMLKTVVKAAPPVGCPVQHIPR
jgi:hypothetical protein